MWVIYAFGSAFFAGMTSILVKCGLKKTNSTVATAIRTIIVLIMSFFMVLIVGSLKDIATVSAKNWVFLVLSGIATSASWLCYFRAIQLGDVNKVAPIDKSSTILTILLAFILLKEPVSWLQSVCVCMIAAGTFMMIEKKEVGIVTNTSRAWLPYAAASAVFAALTSILGKVGISGVESNLGTMIRTIVVLFMSWLYGFRDGKRERSPRHSERGNGVYLRFRDCDGRVVADVLQGVAGRACKRRRANRQTEHTRNGRVFVFRLWRETFGESVFRTSPYSFRHAINACQSLNKRKRLAKIRNNVRRTRVCVFQIISRKNFPKK